MAALPPHTTPSTSTSPGAGAGAGALHLPRITIQYCTQCKWMLRAAYFAQELLSTFSTALGEVALVPATGGLFTVTLYHRVTPTEAQTQTQTQGTNEEIHETILWDRKVNGGFPEVKILKSLVRNVIDPSRDLGHTDRALRAANVPVQAGGVSEKQNEKTEKEEPGDKTEKEKRECEDCQ